MDETPALCFVRGQVPEIWKKDGMPRLRMNQEKVTVLLKTPFRLDFLRGRPHHKETDLHYKKRIDRGFGASGARRRPQAPVKGADAPAHS